MIGFLIAVDQLVKFTITNRIYNSSVTLINGILDLTYIENTGGAFGIGNRITIIFVIVNIIVIALITRFLLLKKDELPTNMLLGLGLIISGGVGNLIDRIFRGFVIDYIDFNQLIKYPVFNIADVCVVLGCMIIGINLILDVIKERNE